MSSHVPLRFALVSVATLFSFGVVAYFSWSFFKSRTSFKKPHHGSDSHNRLPSLSNDPTQAFDVEDEEEEEEEEDDEDDDEEHEKEIRDKYDQQIGLAKKLLAGNAFKRAAEAFSEAIKLVEQLPSAEKDLTILYNNRSAMYEKQNLFNESLSDIEVVLFREPNHIKARSRRARIFDAQGKSEEALQDYVYVMLSEKMQGKEATVSTEPIDKLAKKLASKNAAQLMNELKNNSHVYPVPSKTFSKQFFESFPSCYRWKSDFLDVDRESLVIATGWSEEDSLPERVQYTLNLIQFEIFHKRFTKAFEIISNPVTKMLIQSATSSVSIAESSPEIRSQMLANLSTYHELLGSFEQIVCQLGNAEVEFRIALELNPDNFDAKLKLIMLLAEFGEYEQAEAQYGMWLLSLSSGISVDALDGGTETIKPVTTTGADLVIKAWILTHRAGLWTSRGSDGLYRPDTITKAITDIDAARALVEDALKRDDLTTAQREQLKGAKYVALYKAQYVLNHTKGQMGLVLDDQEREYVRVSGVEAATLYPDSDNSRLQDFESAMMEDDVDKAIMLVDEGIKDAHTAGDAALECAYSLYKANALTNKAFGVLMDPSGGPAAFQPMIEEISRLQERASELDPNSSDALNAQVQLKCMLGDAIAALPLAEKAIKLVRTRDEAQDIYQQYFMTKAQVKSMEEFKGR